MRGGRLFALFCGVDGGAAGAVVVAGPVAGVQDGAEGVVGAAVGAAVGVIASGAGIFICGVPVPQFLPMTDRNWVACIPARPLSSSPLRSVERIVRIS